MSDGDRTPEESVVRENDSEESLLGAASPAPRPPCVPANEERARYITIAVLTFVNLINYMDRYTIAGVLKDIQDSFQVGDGKAGFVQTAFVISYMIFAPIFGYLGDRFSRTYIMAFGVSLWVLTTLLGSFATNYWWFIIFRALVGVGEASYSTIAPTIISDIFVGVSRSKALAIFYFAIPVGSGLGYIVGSAAAKAFGSWHHALQVTPVLGVIAVILILMAISDPERGAAEGGSHIHTTSYKEDIKSLINNPSFMLSTAGFTCVAFVAGALAWWGPTFVYKGLVQQTGNEEMTDNEAFNFGLVSMFSGIIGVPMGSMIAQRLRPRYADCDPLICAFGLLISAPIIYLAFITASTHAAWCYTFIFFGETFFNLTWSLVADILLCTVIPTRRSTAEAFQILISHALGDAGSPYLIGVVSESIKNNRSGIGEFKSLQYALFITSFVEVLGAVFFLLSAFYIVRDKRKVENHSLEASRVQPHNIYADTTVAVAND